MIIGCDYHPGFQQIAWLDTDTGEFSGARLGHKEQAEQFYRDLSTRKIAKVATITQAYAICSPFGAFRFFHSKQ